MTAQIEDEFTLYGARYSLAGISEGELFVPEMLGMKPSSTSTACWRGYQAVFSVVSSSLVVADLHIHLLELGNSYRRLQGPVINGVTPTGNPSDIEFNNHYVGMNHHLDYTGGVLLADGLIRKLGGRMGFHPAWKYKQVIELVFDQGRLVEEFDRSKHMADMRDMLLAAADSRASGLRPSEDEIRKFVERSFDRTYRI